jgi:hypothetical protein
MFLKVSKGTNSSLLGITQAGYILGQGEREREREREINKTSKVSQAQKTIIECFHSYVDFRSGTNTARGLDFGHMIRREHTREV